MTTLLDDVMIDMGNHVLIGDVRIPAVNIQVTNIEEGYGVYFEVLWEDGALWEVFESFVDEGEERSNKLNVCAYPDWAHKDVEESLMISDISLDEFLEFFQERKKIC